MHLLLCGCPHGLDLCRLLGLPLLEFLKLFILPTFEVLNLLADSGKLSLAVLLHGLKRLVLLFENLNLMVELLDFLLKAQIRFG